MLVSAIALVDRAGMTDYGYRSADRDRPPRARSDRARRNRGAHHLHPRSRDGGGARAAGNAPRRPRRAPLRGASASASPRYGSDVGGRRTPWIVGGMAVLAVCGVAAAGAPAWMATNTAAGIVLAAAAFLLIGAGVGASGTSLLVPLAKRVDAARRPAAATIVWVMMIGAPSSRPASPARFSIPSRPRACWPSPLGWPALHS